VRHGGTELILDADRTAIGIFRAGADSKLPARRVIDYIKCPAFARVTASWFNSPAIASADIALDIWAVVHIGRNGGRRCVHLGGAIRLGQGDVGGTKTSSSDRSSTIIRIAGRARV